MIVRFLPQSILRAAMLSVAKETTVKRHAWAALAKTLGARLQLLSIAPHYAQMMRNARVRAVAMVVVPTEFALSQLAQARAPRDKFACPAASVSKIHSGRWMLEPTLPGMLESTLASQSFAQMVSITTVMV